MGAVPQNDDLLDRIRELESQVAQLQRGQTLNGAVISDGALEVRTPSGNAILRIGEFQPGGSPGWGVGMYRSNGTLALLSWDDDAGNGYTSMIDEAGYIVVSTDTLAGQGLATPWIPLRAIQSSEIASPSVTTTSASYTSLWRVYGPKQHPKISVAIIVKAIAGTTGMVRLSVGGTLIGSELTVTDGMFAAEVLEASVSGYHTELLTIDVDAKRTSGAGTIGVSVAYSIGRQS